MCPVIIPVFPVFAARRTNTHNARSFRRKHACVHGCVVIHLFYRGVGYLQFSLRQQARSLTFKTAVAHANWKRRRSTFKHGGRGGEGGGEVALIVKLRAYLQNVFCVVRLRKHTSLRYLYIQCVRNRLMTVQEEAALWTVLLLGF